MGRDFLMALATLTLHASAMNLSDSCPNRYHCRQASTTDDGFKMYYASSTFRENSVLDFRPISTIQVTSRENCMIVCLKNLPCWSVNYQRSKNSQNTSCELLQENEYMQVSSIIPRQGWDHHSVETPCKSIPCKNNASCIPNLASGTFSCECKWPWTGRLCGTYRGLIDRAQGFWNFDTDSTNVGYNQTFRMSVSDGGRIMHVPDRKNPVLYCYSNTLRCAWISFMPEWLTMDGPGSDELCPNGFTMSFWIKHLISTTDIEVFTTHNYENNGINLFLRNHNIRSRTIDWKGVVKSKTGIWQCDIFRGPHALLWTHFALVFYPNDKGVACYVNGIALDRNSIKKQGSDIEVGKLVLGTRFSSSPRSIFYMNDLIIWNEALATADIQYLMKDGEST